MSEFAYDLVIRGGTVVDGSGASRFVGDVAIKDGWIAAVGEVPGKGAEEIDAAGMLVTPGFVDIHTHYDGQLVWSERLAPSSDHGVTTVVTGNCGIGFAPCRPDTRRELIQLMEGVEDIPGAVSEEGLTWDWESFTGYLNAIERRAHDIDFGVLVPHSPIRVYVMGDRALRLEAATPRDIAEMRRLVRDGLEAGAFGVGTSRLKAHKSSQGELIPSYSAEEAELLAIADELRDAGKGVFQMVADIGYTTCAEQLPLMMRVAKAAGRPVTYTHPQSSDWREALDLLDEANAQPGVEIKAQVLPRPIGMMMGLTVSAHPFCTNPTYLRIKDLPLAERVAEMRKPETRASILGEAALDPANPLIGMSRRYDRIFITGATVDYEPPYSQSIAAIARQRGVSADEAAYDAILEEDGRALLILTMGNYEECSLDWMEAAFQNRNIVLGLGDGGAHYGMVCDASFTTFALTWWTRDRGRGLLTVEDVVRRLTSEPAQLMSLGDRGLLRAGYRANINVIDYDRLALHKPCVVADLPAGGKRLHQRAEGYAATIVHGKVIARHGQPTGELPGRLIRGPQSARTAAREAAAVT